MEFPVRRRVALDRSDRIIGPTSYRRAVWKSQDRAQAAAAARRKRRKRRVIVGVIAALLGFVVVSGCVMVGMHSLVAALAPEAQRGMFAPMGDAETSRIDVRDVENDAAAGAIAIAWSALRDNPYGLNGNHGQCLGFVDDVFAAAGYEFRRVCCAACAMSRSEPVSSDLTAIPVGACLYSSASVSHTICENCGRDAGHVGDNQVIHNGDAGIELIDINDFVARWGPTGAGGAIAWSPHPNDPRSTAL